MNGPIAQIAAIVCHGNAALRGLERPRFFPDNSTCQFCDRVEFVELRHGLRGKAKEHAVAAAPDDWFEVLRSEGAQGLRLDHESSGDPRLDDRMSAGFIGGGERWSIATLSRAPNSALWMARWTVWNQQAPANRIWRVTYGKVGEADGRWAPAAADLMKHVDRLRRALAEIAPFARKHECGGFIECFEGALSILDTGAGSDVYHKDLAPQGILPPAASALLAACQKAWVFGGMGSWNDMGFQGEVQTEYERISEALFQAVNAAIAAAANASLAAD